MRWTFAALSVLNRAMQNRPGSLVVVVGTGTEVGKTWVSAAVLAEFRRGGAVVQARKLAQSHAPGDLESNFDGTILAEATGEHPSSVCPPSLTFDRALAPPIAAAVLGLRVPRLADLLAFATFSDDCDVGLIETAGGLRSPQADDADGIDVITALQPAHVVLVADAGLGTISTVRLCVEDLVRVGHRPIVVLNRFSPADVTATQNQRWLVQRDGFEVLVSPDEIGALAERVGLIS